MNPIVPLALLTAAANAAPRTSANYAITNDINDAAGQHTTSANYASDSSAGGVAGISSSMQAAAKHGFIGQLYEVLGFGILATNHYPAEESTTQMLPFRTADDGSLVPVPTTDVVWSILSGPFAGVSATGLVTTLAVAQDTEGMVRGVWNGYEGAIADLPIYVQNTLSDNFGSYAGDGLPDAWQVQFFGENNPVAAPLADGDGDGFTNLFEFLAGLIPTDPSSAFQFEPVGREGALPGVSFHPRLAGHTYVLQRSGDLSGGSWSNVLDALVTDDGETRTLRDPNPEPERGFYRVAVGRE